MEHPLVHTNTHIVTFHFILVGLFVLKLYQKKKKFKKKNSNLRKYSQLFYWRVSAFQSFHILQQGDKLLQLWSTSVAPIQELISPKQPWYFKKQKLKPSMSFLLYKISFTCSLYHLNATQRRYICVSSETNPRTKFQGHNICTLRNEQNWVVLVHLSPIPEWGIWQEKLIILPSQLYGKIFTPLGFQRMIRGSMKQNYISWDASGVINTDDFHTRVMFLSGMNSGEVSSA